MCNKFQNNMTEQQFTNYIAVELAENFKYFPIEQDIKHISKILTNYKNFIIKNFNANS